MNQPANAAGPNTGINLHQQKLISLITGAVAFIGMVLPWSVTNLGYAKSSTNGFAEWGILCLFGVAGVVVACLFGDKTKEFDQNFRYVAIASFTAIVLGSFIQFMKIVNLSGMGLKSGVGVWFCVIAGIIGLLWVTGVIKMPPKVPTKSGPPPPPPPPPSPPVA
jgi:4-amino-4-deoxy-L-arabinose transferase-like glycosyltransferase